MNGLKDWKTPTVINTDRAPTYAAALAELKKESKCPKATLHRQVNYLNNIIEAGHGKLKQLIRALRKGQASAFNITRDIRDETRIVERAFGLGTSALAEVVQLVREHLDLAAGSRAN